MFPHSVEDANGQLDQELGCGRGLPCLRQSRLGQFESAAGHGVAEHVFAVAVVGVDRLPRDAGLSCH